MIRSSADVFVYEGNLYLAKTLYGTLLERIGKDGDRAREMVDIAGCFAHPGIAEALDPVYAEELYQKAMDLAGAAVFGLEALYRRAFNLERLKDYEEALQAYGQWAEAFGAADRVPTAADKARRPEVAFRRAVLSAYGLRDTEKAKQFFQEIIDNFAGDPLVVSARYHLGLLAQWAGESEKAKEHYTAALAKAKELGLAENSEIVGLARARMDELEKEKPLAYGLRLFFEGTFGKDKENISSMPLHVDVTGRLPQSKAGTEVRYAVATSNPMTGCMMPNYVYEWSNEVGGLSNIPSAPELVTDYEEPGLKVVFTAVLGSTGLEGAGFDLVQVK
jgi:tetratricopeptide (TPR) repeat protein